MQSPRMDLVVADLDGPSLLAAWRYLLLLERCGEIDADEADSWREAIYARLDVREPFADLIADDADVILGE